MALLSVVPEAVTTASETLDNLGSALRGASAAAVSQTTAIAPPAADEISSANTALFGSHAREFEAVNARASAYHAQFVNLLSGGAAQYVSSEIANAQQTLVNAINAPAQALLGHPLIQSAAAVNPAAATTEVSYIDTPFGRIGLTQTFIAPDNGNGPVSGAISATTPLGNASFSINGNVSSSVTQSTLSYTGGTFVVPPPLRLLVGAAGSVVNGGFSLFDSYSAFNSALSSGNVLGAATALLSTPFNGTNAFLFGHHSVTLPLSQLGGTTNGPSVSVNIPFGGLFAPSEPITMTVPQYSYTDSSNFTSTITGSNFAFAGSRFGGLGAEVLKLIGLPF